MDIEATVRKILSSFTSNGTLRSRESNIVEFKQNYNKSNFPKYAKTMAAFSNNRGGYIIFGVSDNPRVVIGLKNDNLDVLKQELFTDYLNSLFAPEIEWDFGTLFVPVPTTNGKNLQVKIGWIYTYESVQKPIIALNNNDEAKIASGEVYYRYRARTQKIKHAEMTKIIEERVARERESLLKVFDVIRKSDGANIGIINYSNGKFTTPYGVDIAFDRKIVTQVLRKARYIKEGSFNETDGMPVLKVTGNIDLSEEVRVPEGNPDETHPYIQKQLAEMLSIKPNDLYALIWFFNLKEEKKYHLAITTSKSTKANKIHKFSKYAYKFLKEKLDYYNDHPEEFESIRNKYKNECKRRK